MFNVNQTWSTHLAHPTSDVWSWHARPGAFKRLVPPWESITLLDGDHGLDVGARTVFDLQKGPLTLRWIAEHTSCDAGRSFVDEQKKGPFASWRHEHRFIETTDGDTQLEDEVTWRAPGGLLGSTAIPSIKATNDRMFQFRHRRTARDLARHAPYRNRAPLRIAISGVTGLVGSALEAFLTTGGHEVVRIVRRGARDSDCLWDPASHTVDHERLEGLDGIVHLAGASVAERWTPTQKQAIRDSRVHGTQLIVEAIRRLKQPPRVLISASAIGYYGDRKDDVLTEESDPGDGFLSEVGRAWEEAAQGVTELGVRLVTPRIGIVLCPSGGVLGRLIPLFRAGLGGRVGSGEQWMSWIAIDDLVALIHQALMEPAWVGPINAVAPTPLRQAEQAQSLGRVLGRPAILPAPAPAIIATMGEMGRELLLGGQRVSPKRLEELGFRFDEVDFEACVARSLGGP